MQGGDSVQQRPSVTMFNYWMKHHGTVPVHTYLRRQKEITNFIIHSVRKEGAVGLSE